MAIQKIEIIDNNKIGDCELLAVHNPLVYTIKMSLDDSGDPYDDIIEVDVNISGNETEFIGTFNAPFLKTLNPNERLYIFNADEILRSGLNPIEDYEQDFNSKSITHDDEIDKYLGKSFFLTFRADANGSPIEIIETLIAVNAARDFEAENGANMVDECNHESKIYVGAEGEEAYTYDNEDELYWLYAEIPDNIIHNTLIEISFNNVPWRVGNVLTRGIDQYNKIADSIIVFRYSWVNTPSTALNIQLGANRQESIDNLINYCKETLSSTLGNFKVDLSPDGASTNESIYFSDKTNFYKEGLASLEANANGYVLSAIPDGKNLWFDYIDSDSITHEIRMVAKLVPVLINEFKIEASSLDTINNIITVFNANYPSLSSIVVPTATNKDPFNVSQHILAWNAPDSGTDYSFVDIDIDLTGKGIIDGIDITPEPEQLNQAFLRKKILVDQSLPFEVNMRNVNHVVWPKKFCENSIKIKYIDRNGEYRYHVGESKFKKRTNQKQIGSISRLVTSLKNDLGDEINVGFRNFNTIVVKLNNLRNDRSHTMLDTTVVTLDEIALLQDFYNSPDVQIYISNKWISVIVSGDRAINKSKGNSISPTVTLELPKSYNITQL